MRLLWSSSRVEERRAGEAFGILRQKVPKAELRLIGSGLGPDDPVAVWARSQGFAAGVSFLGRRGRGELADEYGLQPSQNVFIRAEQGEDKIESLNVARNTHAVDLGLPQTSYVRGSIFDS